MATGFARGIAVHGDHPWVLPVNLALAQATNADAERHTRIEIRPYRPSPSGPAAAVSEEQSSSSPSFVAWVSPREMSIVHTTSACADCFARRVARTRFRIGSGDAVADLSADGDRPTLPPEDASVVAAALSVATQTPSATLPPGANSVLEFDFLSGTLSSHSYLSFDDCKVCASRTDRPPHATWPGVRPSPKVAPDVFRLSGRDLPVPELEELTVNEKFGVVGELSTTASGGKFSSVAKVAVPGSHVVGGSGFSESEPASRRIALFEALERYAGLEQIPPHRLRRGTLEEWGDVALDPALLGVSHPRPGPSDKAPLPPATDHAFDPELPIEWVWARSLVSNTERLVPAALVSYGGLHGTLVEDNSNGYALGTSVEEATYFGLMEVVERDAFMAVWYLEIEPPEIAPGSITDTAAQRSLTRLTRDTGAEVRLLDITLEHGVPTVLAARVSSHLETLDPYLVVTAASSLDPTTAIRKALAELEQVFPGLAHEYSHEPERSELLLRHPELVTRMSDHPVRYYSRDSAPLVDFLVRPRTEVHDWSRLSATPGASLQHTDLADDLSWLAGRLSSLFEDVLVVDQTRLEHRALGTSVVKVLVPGMLPMTFGQEHRRVVGRERLEHLASDPTVTTGRDATCLNPEPHPFP